MKKSRLCGRREVYGGQDSGMSEIAERMSFETFSQAHGKHARQYGGTGVGLIFWVGWFIIWGCSVVSVSSVARSSAKGG